MARRYQIFGKLFLFSLSSILIAWVVISLIYNLKDKTLFEQFTLAIDLSVVGYGIALVSNFIVALLGAIVHFRQRRNEELLGFLFFLIFVSLLMVVYTFTFYSEFFK